MVKDFSIKINSTDKTDRKIAYSILLDSIFAVTLVSEGMQIYNASLEGSSHWFSSIQKWKLLE